MAKRGSDEDTKPGMPEPPHETGTRAVHRKLPGEEKFTLEDVYREAAASKEASFRVQEGLRDLQRENTALVHTLETRDENIHIALARIQRSLSKLKRNHDMVQGQVQALGTELEKLSKRQDSLEFDIKKLTDRLEHHGSSTTTPAKHR